ncbi:group III truncated hemoglobin [Chelatococcus composti]|jgi:hemoglobin|uniref:Hemoglobin n=1 Tax=Chelatococcus composti TaxID=1743235 RepID=A0A841K8V8_9HYPH|nr:group III truncated hemoglobin [Chelatococcus composti]MBB6169278.1 hemoglobin [Chelatococcus composti]MBS7735846.1 group III truncated hemoglobin [Chelatococcus composti]
MMEQNRRPRGASPGGDTGIDEAMIERLVRTFYGKARADDLLGPVFAAHVADWEAHIAQICAFWSSVTLKTGRYSGRPMARHLPLPVDARHFDRWLALFEETARKLCPPAAAARFMAHARAIAESLELGIATHNGRLLMRGERYRMDAPGRN